MVGDLQTTVDIYNAAGIPGDLAFDGPIRAVAANIYSAGVPNVIGYAYTYTSGANPNPSAASPNPATVKVGGAGVFAGILMNPKEYPLNGTILGGPLAASLVLPDYAIGDLLYMGQPFVNLPGPSNVGDLIEYDPATGALNSIPAQAIFVGSSSTTTLTVASISQGAVSIGQIISGTGVVPGTYITALGTGKGGTGTYTISISQSIAGSTTLTATNAPTPAFSVTGHIDPGNTPASDPSVLTVSAVASGQIRVGSQLIGVGIPANTTVVSFGTGVGDTGTYNVNTVNLTVGSETITGPSNILIPNAVVMPYTGNTTGGVTAIKLTN